ncbi:MAG: hypothetical protein ABII10_01545 [Candidatus Paceibacterota bacterium]
MTDNSLPTSSSSVPNSYVDSYVPPSLAQAPSQTSAVLTPVSDQSKPTVNQAPPSIQAPPVGKASSPAPSSDSFAKTDSADKDPLAELEKALAEYEARQKQQSQENKKVIDKAEEVAQVSSTKDPLAELEQVLDKYEEHYKQTSQASTDSSAVPTIPAVSDEVDVSDGVKDSKAQPTMADLNDQIGEKISQEEYRSILKGSSAKPIEEITPTTDKDPLAELEKVMNDYEEKRKLQDQSKNSIDFPAPPAAPVSLATPTVDAPEPISKSSSEPMDKSSNSVESIEEQNIFELLGVMDAEQIEKEAFLDELQQALWDDFLDKDLPLLIKPDQLQEIQQLRQQSSITEADRQNQLIAKVEALVPDIEEIMLEKALELKEEMMRERLIGLKEYFADRTVELDKIQEAEQKFTTGRWKTGVQILNSLIA